MALVKWDPFRELAVLQNSLSRLFDDSFGRSFEKRESALSLAFPVDITESEDVIKVKAELPGVNKDEIKVHYDNNLLTISGERKKEEKEEGTNFVRVERSYGSFHRSFTIDIPVKENEIKAQYKDGILEITLPKDKEKTSNQKQITIE